MNYTNLESKVLGLVPMVQRIMAPEQTYESDISKIISIKRIGRSQLIVFFALYLMVYISVVFHQYHIF